MLEKWITTRLLLLLFVVKKDFISQQIDVKYNVFMSMTWKVIVL